MANENTPDILDIGADGKVTHIDSQGVSQGLNMLPFHWRSRSTGKPIAATMYALGTNNLEFRRAEADRHGYDLVEGHHTGSQSTFSAADNDAADYAYDTQYEPSQDANYRSDYENDSMDGGADGY